MPAKNTTLTFSQTIQTTPAEVLRMFLHATALRDWLCSNAQSDLRGAGDFVPNPDKIEVRPGGLIHLRWESGFYATWQITKMEPGKSLSFIWTGKDEPVPTQVKVTVKAKGAETKVTLSHSGLGPGAKWAATRQGVEEGWTTGLENLKSVIETGVDLRIARRPRLGIMFDDAFNAETAKKLGVPVTRGIHIQGTAEGSGARALGWESGDVLVKMAGKPVDLQKFGGVIQGLHAGDKVPVTWYRGSQKMTGELQLGKFPISEVPEPPAALAQAVQQRYDEVNQVLNDLLKDVTDAQANAHPGAEWSVAELVAHFILMARDEQSWLADMLNDTPVDDFLVYRPNSLPRLRAVVQRIPSLAGLLAELHLAQAETINMLEALPPSFVARKHLYRRFGLWLLENMSFHYIEEHNEQFKAAIAAAKDAS